ncbi:MAG: RNA methyltransferase [Clostridia bacterium]|nr:RNA methyltransferase [Clostridia bacterium]
MNNLIFDVPLISGKSNATITEISKLSNKKHRMLSKLFVCDGIKLFNEAVQFGAKIKYIVLDNLVELEENVIFNVKKCASNGAKILCVEKHIFDKLTSENAPQGIITVCEFYDEKHTFSANVKNEDFCQKSLVILESVRDPGNIGTILRNAVALGIDKLILSSDCADIYSPKVVRSSMGAIFKIEIQIVDNLCECINAIKKCGRRVLAAAINDKALILGKDKVSRDDVVVLGNEGHGISQAVIDECSDMIFIPMKGNTESLNVAMASAIIMWEISK